MRASGARCLAAFLPVVLLVACSCGSNRADSQGSSVERPAVHGGPADGGARSAPRAPAAIRGTTVEASSGRPLAGVLVQGPAGTQVVSDRSGRFEIRGLRPGTSGDLVATTEEGLVGRNRLRPLRSGTLEVVVFLR